MEILRRDWKTKIVLILACLYPKIRGNVINKINSPVNYRFVAKTSDIRNFSEDTRSDVKISEVAILMVGTAVRFLE